MQKIIHPRKNRPNGRQFLRKSEFGASDRIRTGDLLRDREA